MGTRADKVRAEFDSKLQEAERLDLVESKLPAEPKPQFIHGARSYGARAHIVYGDSVGIADKACTWDEAVALVRALPPVALTQVRDGSRSFRPRAHEEKKTRWESESDVSPVLIKIDQTHGYAPRMALEWYTDLPEVGVVSVTVHLGLPRGPVGYHVEQNNPRSRHGWSYARPKVTLHPDMHAIHDASGKSVAQVKSPIVWASGSPQSPSPVTIYFVDLGEDLNPADVGRAIVERMAEMVAPRAGDKCPHGKFWYAEVESENPSHPKGSLDIDCNDCRRKA